MLVLGKLNRKGSIPVTIFVIVVMVLLVTALTAFSIKIIRDSGDISKGYKAVQEYNYNFKANEFSGSSGEEIVIRKGDKAYWVFGQDILKVSVSKLLNVE